MTVAVLEPHASGHRAYYVRWIAESLQAAGKQPIIGGGPELLEHPAVAELLHQGVPSVCLAITDRLARRQSSRVGLIRRQFAYRTYFGRLFKRANDEYSVGGVVVPYVDYCLYALAMCGAPCSNGDP